MAELDPAQTTTPTEITDYQTESVSTDGAADRKETPWYNTDFIKWYGKYTDIAKIKIAINAWATWIIGKGWTSSTHQSELDNLIGWGEDSFSSILWNMLVIKKVNGDSFAEIIRNPDDGTLINLKTLDPASIITFVNREGIILRYEQISRIKGSKNKVIQTEKMLHMSNDSVADNIHGTYIIEAVEWNIDAQEEARRVHKNKVKNSGIIGIVEVDTDDQSTITTLKAPIKEGVEKGNFLLVPKGVLEVKPWDVKIDAQSTILWLNYLDDEMFEMMGIPRPIIGGAGDREGDSKVSYLSFEQYYMRAIIELKADLWNQMAVRLEINLPASLQNQLADNELKNTSQVGFQPNDTEAGVGE